MKFAGHGNPMRVDRIIQAMGFALLFLFLGAAAPTRAQDISSIKSGLAAKICPASEYSRITYDDRGCGWSAQKACDEQYRAPSDAWQDCYRKTNECRKQIDADNQVIYEANRVYQQCHQQKPDTDQASTDNRQKPGGSSSGANSGSSDLASRLAAQRAKNATADDVRQQQDQQFANTVKSTQQDYQQFKAQEQQQRTAAALRACQDDYDGNLAVCTGNTGQYYKEGRFPPVWVGQQDTACKNLARAKDNQCRNLAKGDPNGQDANFRRSVELAEGAADMVERSLSALVQQPQDNPGDDQTYAPVYQNQAPNYQQPNNPQRRVTTAPFPQMPAVNPNVPSPVQTRPSGGTNCPYRVCAVH